MADITKLSYPRAFEPTKRGQHWYLEADGQELKLSNLTKVFWPETGYTKGDLLASYYNLAPSLLPYLHDRPLTLWRMPDGAGGASFFEKQAPAHTPDWVPRAFIEGHGSRGAIDFLMAQDTASLLYVANLGCIEMHPMHSRQFNFDIPDYAFFDLDPFPPITFAQVRKVAMMVNVALKQLGLTGYPKISGATGIVVYVPLDGTHSYEEARAFVERVCRLIHKSWPDGTTMEWDTSKRAGKVFLDYGMVREGANIASVYSIRPTPTATVGVPVEWDELNDDVEPTDFTIANVWERLERVGDLFEPMRAAGTPQGQNLNDAMEALGIDRSRLQTVPDRPAAPAEPLKEYKRKRKFNVTPEPEGALVEASEQPLYMIHKHHARRLHYDLRLERGGVLVSFAVPKGLPEEPNVRRLAVHVEDHPFDYATFEGKIPEGEYGAGEVRIFDWGTYETLEWTDSKITIRLHGERIQGEYHIVQTKQGGDPKNWLIFRSAREAPLRKAAPPPDIEPMLATGGGKPFDSKDWVFEPKWDGVRTLAWIDGETLKLRSRRKRDVGALYPELAGMPQQLSGLNGLIDGEIVALDPTGRPSFEAIQQRFTLSKPTQRALSQYPVTFIAFDLLWLDGESLLERPLEERRTLLEKNFVPGASVQISPQIPEKGKTFFKVASERGLEGIVAKKRGSVYRPGVRTKDWVKVKATKTQDCVIVGWAPGQGARAELGSLLVAVSRDGALAYAGHVGTGFTQQTLRLLKERLTPLEIDEPPVPPPPHDEVDTRAVHWVRPELVCSVEYLEFTGQNRMRAASFKGLRDDKAPEECTIET
ncbi:MAG: non-homologous end-joining DNA ligase [Actinomycetota bacterium]